MFFAASTAAVFAASAMVASARPFNITQRAGSYASTFDVVLTPTNLGACDLVTISWFGKDIGLAPHTVEIGKGGFYDANGLEIIEKVDNICDDTLSWIVTTPPGTSMFFRVTSFDGKISYSQNHVVKDTGFCPSDSNSAFVTTADAWIEEGATKTATATETVADAATWAAVKSVTETETSEESTAAPEAEATTPVVSDGYEGSTDETFSSPALTSKGEDEVASDESTTVDYTATTEYNNEDAAAAIPWV
ncbi:hypothetical protein IAT38_008246 [Cryptococcus sp. DSM 104549]